MYSLAKLLTDEPEKLEKLLIAFLKVLIAFYISKLLLGFELNVKAQTVEEFFEGFSISQTIYSIIIALLVWYVLWTIIIEGLFCQLPLWLFSRKGSGWTQLQIFLEMFSVAKGEISSLQPGENVVVFADVLNNYDSEDHRLIEEGKSRLRQMYVVGIGLVPIIHTATDVSIPCWMYCLFYFLLVATFLGCYILRQSHKYIENNLTSLRHEMNNISYRKRVSTVIENCTAITCIYKMEAWGSRIVLQRKIEDDSFPEIIRFHPACFWSQELGKRLFKKQWEKQKDKEPTEGPIKKYTVLICNIDMEEQQKEEMKKFPELAYLFCETDRQIQEKIEILLFDLSKGNYRFSFTP